MKIEKGFVMQKICDKTVLVRTTANGNGFSGIIELNDTAADIWKYLEKGYSKEEVTKKITQKYDVSYEDALKAVVNLSQKMIESGVAKED